MGKYYFYHFLIMTLFMAVFAYDLYQNGYALTVITAIICSILIIINSKKNRKPKTTA